MQGGVSDTEPTLLALDPTSEVGTRAELQGRAEVAVGRGSSDSGGLLDSSTMNVVIVGEPITKFA